MKSALPSSQQGGPYLCFALAPNGWLPPIEVSTAEDAWFWMVNPLRASFDELRVTDQTGDECLIDIVGDELKFPTHVECGMTEERWQEFWQKLSAARKETRRGRAQ